jgi:small GTP-binding protein
VVELDGTEVTLVLWDLAGRDKDEDVGASYLRGSHGVIFVADGTRAETCEQVADLQRVAIEAAGKVPCVIALNKCDLVGDWKLSASDEASLAKRGALFRTSAKSGENVEAMFLAITRALVAPGSA